MDDIGAGLDCSGEGLMADPGMHSLLGLIS